MTLAISQKKIDALLRSRPNQKREIPDGGQTGLYFVIGPRAAKWIVRYRSPSTGENVKLTIGDYGAEKPALGLHDARQEAHRKLLLVSEGHDPRNVDVAISYRSLTVEQAFSTFVEKHSEVRNKASTVREVRAFVDREVVPRWRRRKFQTIMRSDIVALVDAIAADRPHAAVKGRAILSKAFGWFAMKGIVTESPFRDIEVPAPSVQRDRVLTDDEIRWLWSATAKIGWPFGDLARLLLLTGQRRNEVAWARWSEFDLESSEPVWTIPGERTKNGRPQILPLSPPLVGMLKSLPRIVDEGGKPSPFLLTTTGTTPISGFSRPKKKLDEEMLKAAREIGAFAEDATLESWTYHDLRRTAASGMAGLGVPVHVVEAVLNHKSGAISGVAAIYNRHDYMAEKRQALEAWANRVDLIIGSAIATNVVNLKRA